MSLSMGVDLGYSTYPYTEPVVKSPDDFRNISAIRRFSEQHGLVFKNFQYMTVSQYLNRKLLAEYEFLNVILQGSPDKTEYFFQKLLLGTSFDSHRLTLDGEEFKVTFFPPMNNNEPRQLFPYPTYMELNSTKVTPGKRMEQSKYRLVRRLGITIDDLLGKPTPIRLSVRNQ